MMGYRSDFDLLVVVNNNKLSDFAYWYKAKGRLERDRAIKTPTSFIVHSRRFAGLGRSWADKGPDSVAAHLTGAHTPATLDSNPDSLIQVHQAEWQVPSRHVILLRQRGGKLVGETGSSHR